MIVYVCCEADAQTLAIQLHFFRGELAKLVRLIPYEYLYRLDALPVATYVFSDFDRLDSEQFERVCRLWNWLDESGTGLRRLNDPRRVLQRFSLLRQLHAQGLNSFNVYRLDEWRDVQRFPVFIRRERGHGPHVSQLIDSPRPLREHIERYSMDPDAADMMIVEFGSAPWSDGRYRKFGVFRAGDAVYLQHCFITNEWYAKDLPSDASDADRAEADGYRATNPHARDVLRAFEIAQIEYGRADYCVVDGRVQIFEINTNPTIISLTDIKSSRINSAKLARLHENAMLTLEANFGEPLPLPEALRDHGPCLSPDQIHEYTSRMVIRPRVMRQRRKKLLAPVKRALRGWAWQKLKQLKARLYPELKKYLGFAQ